jgi:putative Mg2+ transporter-C (MgtC) family protein
MTLAMIQTALPALLRMILARLCMAGFLGGVIGLEREFKRKPAGLRTNMFICIGSAMFTILSTELASQFTGDHTRIAAQIIPGIGFIGAGSILHSRGSVSGLTTAATLFVVASIGMAVGGGLYLPALFATLIIFLALEVLGWFEGRFHLKATINTFEAVGVETEALLATVNGIVDELDLKMRSVRIDRDVGRARVQFTVEASREDQRKIYERLRTSTGVARAETIGVEEAE